MIPIGGFKKRPLRVHQSSWGPLEDPEKAPSRGPRAIGPWEAQTGPKWETQSD